MILLLLSITWNEHCKRVDKDPRQIIPGRGLKWMLTLLCLARFTKTEYSVILLMAVKSSCQAGWGLFNAHATKRSRTWQCFSTVGVFTIGPSGIFLAAGSSWCGTMKNIPSFSIFQRWWKQEVSKVRYLPWFDAWGWSVLKQYFGIAVFSNTLNKRRIMNSYTASQLMANTCCLWQNLITSCLRIHKFWDGPIFFFERLRCLCTNCLTGLACITTSGVTRKCFNNSVRGCKSRKIINETMSLAKENTLIPFYLQSIPFSGSLQGWKKTFYAKIHGIR